MLPVSLLVYFSYDLLNTLGNLYQHRWIESRR
jgi:hypothetical protein